MPPAWLASSKRTTVEPARSAKNACRSGSITRSWPEIAYQEGSALQAAGPDGSKPARKLIGRWAALSSAAFFGLRSWQKTDGKMAGSMYTNGNTGTIESTNIASVTMAMKTRRERGATGVVATAVESD